MCPHDPNSYANTQDILITHVALALTVDFDRKILHGSVTHTAVAQRDDVSELVMDINHLEIKTVSIKGSPSPFELGESTHPSYGAPLTIRFNKRLNKNESITVCIEYKTTTDSLAIQWLEPEQTVGKVHPYLFTQCQPIYARTLVPIQDTPFVKLKYDAEIRVPAHLRALMSAVPVEETVSGSTKTCKFTQKIAIPSYLIALAVGNIEGRKIGHRSTVWSEPEVVAEAAWEFEDTEKFIAAGEALLTPYVWGVYDVLLLPSSFPYGGMENPCLTFVTPSLLAGDRSLVDVVAHEIAHSWMGNLVTSASWEHFWLNEGFTVCIERKIMRALHGIEEQHFSAIIGCKALEESVARFEEMGKREWSCLCPRLSGVDPDDVFSSVPYEKGFHLLFYLENILGGEVVFDAFLKNHVETFSHKSITTQDFKDNLYRFFSSNYGAEKVAILDTVDWDAWFNKPGMPPVKNTFSRTLSSACEALAESWHAHRLTPPDALPTHFHPSDTAQFTSPQTVVFLERVGSLEPKLGVDVLAVMEKVYGLKGSRNCEVKTRWLLVCLEGGRVDVFGEVVEFVTKMGRMKYVRPLYRALAKCNATGKELARETFKKHKSFYHPICAALVEKDIMG